MEIDWHFWQKTRIEHQVYHLRPVLFRGERMFTLSTCNWHERVWRSFGECYAACYIIHDQFDLGSVWRGISTQGQTDLYRLGIGTNTTIRWWNPWTHCEAEWSSFFETMCSFWTIEVFSWTLLLIRVLMLTRTGEDCSFLDVLLQMIQFREAYLTDGIFHPSAWLSFISLYSRNRNLLCVWGSTSLLKTGGLF